VFYGFYKGRILDLRKIPRDKDLLNIFETDLNRKSLQTFTWQVGKRSTSWKTSDDRFNKCRVSYNNNACMKRARTR